jgi:hypothetical protein
MIGRPVQIVGVRPISLTEKVRFAVEILSTYARVRWHLFRQDFPTALADLRSETAPPPSGEAARLASLTGIRIGNAVVKALRVLPTDSRCLMRSLVLTVLLVRRGIDSSLIIGVRPGAEFQAHAWLEREEIPLLPAGSEYGRLLET